MAAAAAHYAAAEVDSGTDSVTSTPRSTHNEQAPVRLMCSFGGKIVPRPQDNQLRYVGGDTRIVSVHRSATFAVLLAKLSKLACSAEISIKYQLPNEDLDALITVTTDEDVENMMEELERNRGARLRLFLFPSGNGEEDSRTIASLLDGSSKRESWFLDALNGGGGGGGLERGRSEASSMVSEVPDYLFGFDNPDETTRDPKLKTRFGVTDTVSCSDPGSPAPRVSSPFGSTSSAPASVPPMPNLPPVKTKVDNPVENPNPSPVQVQVHQSSGYSGPSPVWGHQNPVQHYPSPPVQPVPVYYVTGPGPVPHGSAHAHMQHVPISSPFVQGYQVPVQPGQVPVGYHQAIPGSGPGMGVGSAPVYGGQMIPGQVGVSGPNHGGYYGVKNGGIVAAYPGMVVPTSRDDGLGSGPDANMGRAAQI